MDKYTLAEVAYKNGYADGSRSVKAEICTRVKVAYEQLSKAHTELCRNSPYREDIELIYDVQDILNAIAMAQVKLGMLKREDTI